MKSTSIAKTIGSIISICFLVFISANVQAMQTRVTPLNHVSSQSPEDDIIITRSIQSRINESPILSKFDVSVSTHRGIVTLTGLVDSSSQAATLIEIAESTVGVSDVNDKRLQVRESHAPLTDTYITAKIKGLLIREKLFGERDIAAFKTAIETTNGVVYITGVIDNHDQINNAIAIIQQNIPEVKKVEYHVKKFLPAANGE